MTLTAQDVSIWMKSVPHVRAASDPGNTQITIVKCPKTTDWNTKIPLNDSNSAKKLWECKRSNLNRGLGD